MTATLPLDSLAFALLNAAHVVAAVLGGQSLADGLLAKVPSPARPAVQDLVYGSLRQYGCGDFLLSRLLEKPLGVPAIHALLLVALYRLESRPESAHTVVDQTVRAAGSIVGGRLKGLVNGVLRTYLRRRDMLLAEMGGDEVAGHAHPDWWIRHLREAHPQDWQAILAAGNSPPPMALRVNRRRVSRDQYADQLGAAGIDAVVRGEDGLLLVRPVPVDRLPGFGEGLVSVQDLGAQRAAAILDPATGSRVLDACAAPGGKTAHLLERADLDLFALDLKPARCRRIEDNLERLGLQAQVQVADASRLDRWWDGQPFDAVLADVPCTASGVVRRHPDAKWLRREADIESFARTQSSLLDALWRVVKPGGKLLYATCSVFPEENTRQVDRFVARQPQALRCHEELLLPDAEHDGFYYCLLEKPF